jgi:hypothetical protein
MSVMVSLAALLIVLDLVGVLPWVKKEVSAALAHRRQMQALKAREEAAWLRDKTIEGRAD